MILLVHGGLGDGMNADRFWTLPGISPALREEGFRVLAPDRPRRPPHWAAEAEHLAAVLPRHPVTVVAGSNGCSAAVRLALAFPHLVEGLLLAWPATAGDAAVDFRARADLASLGASDQDIRALLDGQTLRGVTDDELAGLAMQTGVLPSNPGNRAHQRRTVDALLRLVPDSEELPGCPEPPDPGFAAHLDRFLATITEFAGR
ncbi:alpha/beta fold hydrolase [Actinosynnema sp. NPDC059335]|uniref:alpha/beta fold hydrolase n=1 Tax=Actinosynnema sp. NPDC059335 TaxID=3346804 RepID=UPI00366F3B3A